MDISLVKNLGIWGDSIMKGIVYDEVKKKYKTLKDTSIAILNKKFSFTIKNNSRFGCTAPKALKSLKSSLIKGYTPDIAVLEFGGNDCDRDWVEVSKNPETDHLPKTPLPEFCRAMETMIDLLVNNSIKPILMNLPPINGQKYFEWISNLDGVNSENVLKWLVTPYTMYRQQERYSMEIERMAMVNGLKLIDVRSRFLEMRNFDEYLCVDGIHLNENGQKMMGNVFSEFAKTYI